MKLLSKVILVIPSRASGIVPVLCLGVPMGRL